MKLTKDFKVKLATDYIQTFKNMDEDTKQDIYLKALEDDTDYDIDALDPRTYRKVAGQMFEIFDRFLLESREKHQCDHNCGSCTNCKGNGNKAEFVEIPSGLFDRDMGREAFDNLMCILFR